MQKRENAAWMRERYYPRNRHRCAMYQHLLRLAFSHEMAARAKISNAKHRMRNREAILLKKRAAYRANPTRALCYCRKRQVLIAGATCWESTGISVIYERAKELRRWFNVVVDHIIPLAKGGRHEVGNLQIIYRSENARKSSSLSFRPSVIFS